MMKNYNLKIIENIHGVVSCNEQLIYKSSHFLVYREVNAVKRVSPVCGDYTTSCIFDDLLVSYNGDPGNKFLRGGRFNALDLGEGLIRAKHISNLVVVCMRFDVRPKELFLYELGYGVRKRISSPDRFGTFFDVSDKFILVRTKFGKNVVCFNCDLELCWEKEFEKGWLPGYIEPTVYNGLVLFNQFDELVSLDLKTGDEVWRHTFDSVPTSCSLVGDKIYAVDRGDVVVLSSASGEEITRFNSGFQVINDITGQNNLIECFPFCEDIVISAGYEGCVKVVSEDGRDDFGTWKIDSYRPHNNGVRANELSGKLYLSVRNMNAYSRNGLLVLEKGHDGKVRDEVNVDERVNAQIFAYPSIRESHSIVMYFAPRDLYDAVIIGPLYVEEFYYATGYFPIFDGEQGSADHKHNGVIQLVIDPSNLEGDYGEALRTMEFEINEQIKASTVMAGDKKSPIAFELTLKPKHEWSLDGERIDWPAMRELNEPIS